MNRETCPWCAHPWNAHGHQDGCEMEVGIRPGGGICPCQVTCLPHGQALEKANR